MRQKIVGIGAGVLAVLALGWGAVLLTPQQHANGQVAPPGSAIGQGTRDRPAFTSAQHEVISATLTRETNTTQYSAGDEISNDDTAPTILTLADAARINGGSGTIHWIEIIDSINTGTDADIDVFVYDTTSTPNNDNAAFAPSDAVSNTCILAKDMGSPVASGANNEIFRVEVDVPYECGASSDDLFVRLVERSTYTPASAEQFVVRMGITRD